MEMIKVKINGIEVEVEKNTTILDAAKKVGVRIPTLCYLREINAIGACRICLVEVKGARGLCAACVYPLDRDGIEVITNSPQIREYRKTTLELILSNHRMECLSCVRSDDCELRQLCAEYGVDQNKFKPAEPMVPDIDEAIHLVRDNSKCILCRRCVAVCKENQFTGVIGANNRGYATHIGSPFDEPLSNTSCVSCGQCTAVCPTGALTEKDDTDKVWAAIADPTKHVVAAPAP